MSNYKKGLKYEDFIELVYQSILNAESKSKKFERIKLQRRKKIKSKSGTTSEIDIYWEYKFAGIINSVAIECRNQNRNVSIAGIRDFARKISDISGLKGLVVSSKGFSKHAIKEAEADNIDLLIIRPPEEKDWEGALRKINMTTHFHIPPNVSEIRPFLNKEWAKNNGFDESTGISLKSRNDMIVIRDKENNFEKSIMDLQKECFGKPTDYGLMTWEKDLRDGWLEVAYCVECDPTGPPVDKSYKIRRIEIEYINSSPHSITTEIDFTKSVLAIQNFITGEQGKSLVLYSGIRKSFG